MSEVISADGLVKSFGDQRVVDGLDFHVAAGQVFGLLGPNGAGKTTTIRMLATLLAPDTGRAQVCGFDVLTQAADVRSHIGYVMQQVHPLWQITGREKAEIEAALYHVPRRQIRKRVDEVLELVGLSAHADKLAYFYSGGMKKRLDIACGLLHRPQLLILDEPTLGVDVQSRHRIWDHIKDLRDAGVTVLLATNYLDEADLLCDELLIIDHGREVAGGSPQQLKRSVGQDVIRIETTQAAALATALADQPWAMRAVADTEALHLYVGDATIALPAVMRIVNDLHVRTSRITYSQPTLDDVFLLHTGRELREAEVAG